jgi:hypothetical protein
VNIQQIKELNMKKKIIFTILILFIALAWSGCEKKKATVSTADTRITVTAATFPGFDFARVIAGDRINLSMLLPPGAESHSYEPTPQDIIKIQNSDVFIYTGGESDYWIGEILDSVDNGSMRILSLMGMVDVVEEEIVEGMEDEEEDALPEDLVSPEYDEHVWTSPRKVLGNTAETSGGENRPMASGIGPGNKNILREPSSSKTGELVEIKEKMFLAQTNDVYLNPEDYLGKTIKLEGVFKREYYEENDSAYCFVLRYGPGCCGNDGNAGFEIAWDSSDLENSQNQNYPEDDAWVEAVGVLSSYEEEGYPYLYLALSSLKVKEERGAEFVAQ